MVKQMFVMICFCLLFDLSPARHSFGEGDIHQEIDTQIKDFSDFLTNYEELDQDVTAVRNGLDNLGFYYSRVSMSLARTKLFITRLSQENRKLSDEGDALKKENERLKTLLNIDKEKLKELLD